MLTMILSLIEDSARAKGVTNLLTTQTPHSLTLSVKPFTVRVNLDDTDIRVTVENRGIVATASFSNMPAAVIAPVISSYLFNA